MGNGVMNLISPFGGPVSAAISWAFDGMKKGIDGV